MKIKIINYKSKYKFSLGQIVNYKTELQSFTNLKILGILDGTILPTLTILDDSCILHPKYAYIYCIANRFKNRNYTVDYIGYIVEFPPDKFNNFAHIDWCRESNFYEIY